jgi:ABC-2 type transport system permease protein
MSTVGMTLRQVGYTNRTFWRNPASAFFTFAFPIMFLVIFSTLFGNDVSQLQGRRVTAATLYVPAMAAFSIISACYTNIAISVAFARDGGILKRIHGTPLPAASYIVARVIHAVLVGLLLVAIVCAFGVLFYDVTVPTGAALARFLLSLIVGSAAFAALGLAIVSAIPNADAAPAVVNASVLPLLFLSGVFIPLGADAPQWMKTIGDVFPVKHFVEAAMGSFYGPPLPFQWSDVLFVAVWGLGGLALATKFFSWEPRK